MTQTLLSFTREDYLPDKLKDKGKTPTKKEDKPRIIDRLDTQIKASMKD